ncbi:xylulokinase [Vallitalea sediminicola]
MVLLMGIDIGTTACKVAVYDENANVISMSRKEYKLSYPRSGWAEIDPNEMWEAVKFCIGVVVKQCKEKITAISVSSHGEGVIPLDRMGNPVGAEIVSFDTRSMNETYELENKFGKKYFFDKGGQILASTGTITKIIWIKKHYDLLKKTPYAYVCAGDYIIMRLSGQRIIDYSLAARTMMLDIHKKEWNQELMEYVGLKEEQLSIPLQSGTVVGTVRKKIAFEIGLNADALIVTGGHDQPCGMIGAGAIQEGEAAYSLGTTETLVCSMKNFVGKLYEYGLPCYPHVLKNQYITIPGNFTGGNLLQWYKNLFAFEEQEIAKKENKNVYDILMEEMTNQPSEVIVLPHFTTTGSPWNDSMSRGMIVGLQLSTTKGEYLRALQEGVTLEILLNLQLLKKAEIKVKWLIAVGGSTKSKKLMQLKTDVLGVPIHIPTNVEAACKGAAFMAGYGIGIFNKSYNNWSRTGETDIWLTPCSEKHKLYLNKFKKYKRMYSIQKEILR